MVAKHTLLHALMASAVPMCAASCGQWTRVAGELRVHQMPQTRAKYSELRVLRVLRVPPAWARAHVRAMCAPPRYTRHVMSRVHVRYPQHPQHPQHANVYAGLRVLCTRNLPATYPQLHAVQALTRARALIHSFRIEEKKVVGALNRAVACFYGIAHGWVCLGAAGSFDGLVTALHREAYV